MTWLLASVLCIIPGILCDNHQQMSFPWNNVLFIADNHAITPVVHRNLFLLTNKQQWTDKLHISVLWETPATCNYTQQNSSWVKRPCWHLITPFGLEANYIILRTSHLFLLASSWPILHQQIMDTQPAQPGLSGSKSSQLAGTSSNTSLISTHQERRHQLVHGDTANAANINLTQNAYFKMAY